MPYSLRPALSASTRTLQHQRNPVTGGNREP